MDFETSQGEIADLVANLRAVGVDGNRVEVKAAGGGVPKDLWPTVSSFSNGTGGVIILGLSEGAGFTPAAGFNAHAIRDAASEAFRPRSGADAAGPISPALLGP